MNRVKYVFIINPVAGRGKLQQPLAQRVKTFFESRDLPYEIHFTTAQGDTRQFAEQCAETGEEMRIFACGGEGTVNDVLNGIRDRENIELGVIPCGSANDFLKCFEDRAPFSDLAAQVDGTAQPMDLIAAGDRLCLNGCSVGMDAMIAHDMGRFKHWPLVSGGLAYKLAIVRNYFKRKLGVTVDLEVDGASLGTQNCLFALIANGPVYGGGFCGAPAAKPQDGKLDFTLVETISHGEVLKFLPQYEKGKFEHLAYCHTKICKEMVFRAVHPLPVNMDGEIALFRELKFSLVPHAVRFIIPRGAVLKG